MLEELLQVFLHQLVKHRLRRPTRDVRRGKSRHDPPLAGRVPRHSSCNSGGLQAATPGAGRACAGVGRGAPETAEERTGTTPPLGPTPGAVTENAHHFVWKLEVTNPNFETQQVPLSVPNGKIPISFDRWRCEYSIDHAAGTEGSRDGSGWVRCALGNSGAKVSTMVICQEADARPSDCGTGTLRVADDGGRLHDLAMSCKSASSDCWERPRVTELPVGAPAPTGSGSRDAVAGARAPGAASDAGPKGVRLRERDGSLHFQWKLDVVGATSNSRSLSPGDVSGEVVTGLDGWHCSYDIAAQVDPIYSQLEIGHVTCQSKRTGAKAQGVLLCAESSQRPSACNMGSLSITDDTGQKRTILMSCRGATNPCRN